MNQQSTENSSNLTQSQLLIWTGQQLSSNVPLYNVVFTFEFDGEINIEHFQNAFQILIDKSDSMRTVFETIDDIPNRNVLDSVSYVVEFLDFSSEKTAAEQFQSWVDERVRKNFDLSKPLFDSVLIKIPNNKFIWYFNQHHLICDAWSVSVQYKALAETYGLLSKGTSVKDFELPQFKEYAEYEKNNHLKLKDSSINK
ncbi:MAG: condensation domain-containing protein, partial [Acidobacteriota bacterium]